jgi:hypothetical protein
MFNFFKKKSSLTKASIAPIEAKAAKNLATLSNQALALKAVEDSKEYLDRAFAAIKKQSEQGQTQMRLVIMAFDYYEELQKQAPVANFEIQDFIFSRAEDAGLISKYLNTELSRLGYGVVVRELKVQFRRVSGDSSSKFVGHEVMVAWG